MARKPLWDAMEKYYEAHVYPMHTPGHKGGRGMARELQEVLGRKALAMDVSLMSELDDLHRPETCLKEAQELAAQLYGADQSYFAVNGTTGAIHAMFLGAFKPGDAVLIPRNAHRSVTGALILAQLQPVYLMPHYSKKWGLSLQITPEDIERTLKQHQEIKGVFLTSPNYYGLAADVAAIARICHERRLPLLVDEAHGPHLGFSKVLPQSAWASGADAVAQSTHKLVGALTQCSMLHVHSELLSAERMRAAMSMVTTTSPNYLLMASLDLARAQLEDYGAVMAEEALAAADRLRLTLEHVPYLRVLEQELVGEGGVVALDKTKVTVNVNALGRSGVEIGAKLREAGIAVELVDRDNILFLVTYADASPSFEGALAKIEATFKELSQDTQEPWPLVHSGIPLPFPVLPPAKAFYAASKVVPFNEAAGELCAEQISFYPPGIPVVVPGERLTREVIDYCQSMLAAKIPVSGPADSTLTEIRVVTK